MELEEAWLKIMEMENSERFKPNQIHSILADLGVFKTNPRIRLVLKAALYHNIWDLIQQPKNSSSAISLLKSKLCFDGFSNEMVNEVISSFYLKESAQSYDKLNNTNQNEMLNGQLQEISLAASTSGGLMFQGMLIGSSISGFDSKMKLSCTFIKQIGGKASECCKIYEGKFAHLKECTIKMYFNDATQQTYKIVIASKSRISKMPKEYEDTLELYSTKYGKHSVEENLIGKGPNEIKIEKVFFSINADQSIEIRRGPNSLMIFYRDSKLEKTALDTIEKQKEKELLKERMNNLKEI